MLLAACVTFLCRAFEFIERGDLRSRDDDGAGGDGHAGKADSNCKIAQEASNSNSAAVAPAPLVRILIASQTNTAVDNVLLLLKARGFDAFARVGSVRKIAKPILRHTLHSTVGSSAGAQSEVASSNSSTASQSTSASSAASDAETAHHIAIRELQQMAAEEERISASAPLPSNSPDLSPADADVNANSNLFYIRSALAEMREERAAARAERLQRMRVVGATCAAAAAFDALGKQQKFSIVIVDECSQLVEPLSLVPVARFQSECLMLVGDPRQLPPIVFGATGTRTDVDAGADADRDVGADSDVDADSDLVDAAGCGISQSKEGSAAVETLAKAMFVRLGAFLEPVLLRKQYRLHPALSEVVNALFYESKLEDGIADRDRPALLAIASPAPPPALQAPRPPSPTSARSESAAAAAGASRATDAQEDGEVKADAGSAASARGDPAGGGMARAPSSTFATSSACTDSHAQSQPQPSLPPLTFIDVPDGRETGVGGGGFAEWGGGRRGREGSSSGFGSLWNHAEASAARDVVAALVLTKGVHPARIGQS